MQRSSVLKFALASSFALALASPALAGGKPEAAPAPKTGQLLQQFVNPQSMSGNGQAKGHLNDNGKGHDIGHGIGHIKYDDGPVSP